MADHNAMEIEDSNSDTVEYDIPASQPNREQPEAANNIAQNAQLSEVVARVHAGEDLNLPVLLDGLLPEVSVIPLRAEGSPEPPEEPVVAQPTTVKKEPQQASTSSSTRRYSSDDDDDGRICPICLEAWTNCGDHRICALKCGHLFGYNCVQRWLDSQSSKSCPTCKKKVRRSDLRFIYAKRLVAVDNVELEAIKDQLQDALAEKNKQAQEIHRYISREHVFVQEISQLKKKIQDLSLGSKTTDLRMSHRNPVNRLRLYMDKNIDVCSQNDCRDCRVFDVNVGQNLVSVATRSPVGLFGGFGLRDIDLQSYKNIRFSHLHKSPIRDVSFHESNPWVVTASTDKSFKVTDIHGNGAPIQAVTVSAPLWSCCWDPNFEFNLYVGAQNGSVTIYDIRNTAHPFETLTVEGDFSPVVSVAGIKRGPYSDVPEGAVLACRLNSVWAFETISGGLTYKRHLLPLDGPFLSLRYANKSKQLLVSARPNSQKAYVRHTVCNLQKLIDPETVQCNIIHTFRSGTLAKYLARGSCFVSNDYVAGLHEGRKSVILYSINTGDEITSIPAHSATLDLKGFETSSGNCLAVLTEKKLEFFKFTTST